MLFHPFSLVERDSHPESVYELLELKVDRSLIATIVEETTETVTCALGLPTTSRGRSSARMHKDKEIAKFVERVLEAAETSITDILVTLIYLRRSRAHLNIETEEWALHRVFLGALVLAHKYSNDSTLKNISWSHATGAFGMRDIGRMEREFLDVLDYELSVSEADLLDLHETLVTSRSSQPTTQLHPFFHSSAFERAPRPQGGVELFRTRRVSEEDKEDSSTSSETSYTDELTAPLLVDEEDSTDVESNVETRSSVPSSPETPSTSVSSSEPSTTVSSVFSYNPRLVSKPAPDQEGAQRSVISRALWLAGHQIISSLPSALPQVAVSS